MKLTQADIKAVEVNLAALKVAKLMGGSTSDGAPLAGLKYSDRQMKSVFVTEFKTWNQRL
jgi:hypothetical protein